MACCDDCAKNEALVAAGLAQPEPCPCSGEVAARKAIQIAQCPCAAAAPGVGATAIESRRAHTVGVGQMSPTTNAVLLVLGGAVLGFAAVYAYNAYKEPHART